MSVSASHSPKNAILLTVLMVYILMCLAIGGASRFALNGHVILQITAAIGIAILCVTWPSDLTLKSVKVPIYILGAVAIVGIVQCVPLSAAHWRTLPGRNEIFESLNSLGVTVSAMPLSLDVESTRGGLGYVLTPLFIILLCARIGLPSLQRVMPAFFCLIGVVFVLIGLSQVYLGDEGFLYAYENTTIGAPVGAFANVNHFASLMLMISPFAIYLIAGASSKHEDIDQRTALMVMSYSSLLLLTIGIVAAGSLAIYLISVPIITLAFFATRGDAIRLRRHPITMLLILAILGLGVSIAWNSPVLNGLGLTGSAEDPTSRQNMWSFTIAAIKEYWPIGSGISTYQSVIPHFENPDEVTSRYVALAHNEYLQLAMELGAAGVVIVFGAVAWLVLRARAIWLGPESGQTRMFRKMAFLGILVCVLHSVVDYPARTPAMASVLAVHVALISVPKAERPKPKKTEIKSSKRLIL